MDCFKGAPYVQHASYLKEYYLLVTGYHLSQLIVHGFGTKRNDFVEMFLHHLVTIYLMFGSYLFNCWECGAIIIFLHDFSDIFGALTKFFGNMVYEKISMISLFMLMGTWFWTRCLTFPIIIYQIWQIQPYAELKIILPIYVLLLSILAVLHFYWFHFFVKIVFFYKKHGKAEDL